MSYGRSSPTRKFLRSLIFHSAARRSSTNERSKHLFVCLQYTVGGSYSVEINEENIIPDKAFCYNLSRCALTSEAGAKVKKIALEELSSLNCLKKSNVFKQVKIQKFLIYHCQRF